MSVFRTCCDRRPIPAGRLHPFPVILEMGNRDRRSAVAVVVWVEQGVWEAAVDAARTIAAPDAAVVLLHVISGEIEEVASGALAGLLGRRYTVAPTVEREVSMAAEELLQAAEDRLGRPARKENRRGRVEREVVAAAADADLLVVSRDGDKSRLGPHSLGPATRFVVDHAPCPVLLVWPGRAPSIASIPPPPPAGPAPPPPPTPGSAPSPPPGR